MPWSQAERLELFDWMAGWGLNTYLYAPKDDLKHRAIWREPYTHPEVEQLRQLIRSAAQNQIRFVYGISPGLDIRYGEDSELEHLLWRITQMADLGCQDFALLFDDIPDRPDTVDLNRFTSLASAQCQVANALFTRTLKHIPGTRFLFCPAPYCGRMAERKLGGEGYLETVGTELAPEIDVFWTGPEIISREISVEQAQNIQRILRRKPLIWDNLHANDYDARRFFCGPYSGRPRELCGEVRGILLNPNCEFPLNRVPLHTFAEFLKGKRPYHPRPAYLTAMREWHAQFSTVGPAIELDELTLFADCYYLPHEEGPMAEDLRTRTQDLLGRDAKSWGPDAVSLKRDLGRLREFCSRLALLQNRPLFHSVSRRAWNCAKSWI